MFRCSTFRAPDLLALGALDTWPTSPLEEVAAVGRRTPNEALGSVDHPLHEEPLVVLIKRIGSAGFHFRIEDAQQAVRTPERDIFAAYFCLEILRQALGVEEVVAGSERHVLLGRAWQQEGIQADFANFVLYRVMSAAGRVCGIGFRGNHLRNEISAWLLKGGDR